MIFGVGKNSISLRNCCYETQSLEYLLSAEISLFSHLLYPLRSASLPLSEKDEEGLPHLLATKSLPADKEIERDVIIVKYILEALVVLSTTGGRRARDQMRAQKVYPVIRDFDKCAPATVKASDELEELTLQIVENLMLLEEKKESPVTNIETKTLNSVESLKEEEDKQPTEKSVTISQKTPPVNSATQKKIITPEDVDEI